MELFKFEYFVKKCSKFEGNPSKTRKIVQTLENSENGTFPKVCWVFRDKMELSIKWNFWSNFASFKTQNGTPFYRETPVGVYFAGLWCRFASIFKQAVSHGFCLQQSWLRNPCLCRHTDLARLRKYAMFLEKSLGGTEPNLSRIWARFEQIWARL